MNKDEQTKNDQHRHLDTLSESNREKHINFIDVEEETSNQINNDRTSDQGQKKEWDNGIEKGKRENQNPSSNKSNSGIPLNNDETIGIP